MTYERVLRLVVTILIRMFIATALAGALAVLYDRAGVLDTPPPTYFCPVETPPTASTVTMPC